MSGSSKDKQGGDDVTTQMGQFCKACYSLEGTDITKAATLAEVCKAHMQAKALEAVGRAQGIPMLQTYASDGTRMTSKYKIRKSSSSGKDAQKTGTETNEYLVQHEFIRYVSATGKAIDHAVLQDPLPMKHGKGGNECFTAFVEFQRPLRNMGHTGITIQHHAFDRALFSILSRLVSQWHQNMDLDELELHGHSDEAKMRVLKVWVLFTPCAVHDCHNGLKWSLKWYFDDEELVKLVWGAVEALRNSLDLLFRSLPAWLMEVVAFTDDNDLPLPDDLQELWASLGAPPDAISIMS